MMRLKPYDISVDLSNGIKLPSQMAIWTVGARPSALLYHSGLSNGPEQWGDVKQTLQSRHYENIFIAGDAAGLDHPVSKQAYHNRSNDFRLLIFNQF